MHTTRLVAVTLLSWLLIGFMCTPTWCYSPYSNRELDQLEREFIDQINQSPLVIHTPLAEQYINHLGKRLAQHGDIKTPFFFIVNSNEINAFAGPGGYIGVNTHLILATDNESELAAVMAHEMSHVRLHHLYRMLEHEKQMKIPMLASMLASIALGVVNPMLGSGAIMATLGGFAQSDINFIRSNEKEADRIGIDILTKAGLDPRGMSSFFKKMQDNSRYYSGSNIPNILRTHPIDAERIAEAENRYAHLKLTPVDDSIDYRLFKELVRTAVNTNNKALLEDYQRCIKNQPQNTPCRYGHALVLSQINQNNAAEEELRALLLQEPENVYVLIALVNTEIANHHANKAVDRLSPLQNNHLNNDALMLAYADSLAAANQLEKAAMILLKVTRLHPRDVKLCETLAQAYAANHRNDYAYFTEAQGALLQNQPKEAIRLLKLSKQLAQKDKLLLARIEAKLEEIND